MSIPAVRSSRFVAVLAALAVAPVANAAPSDDLAASLAPIAEPHRVMLDAHARLTATGANGLPVALELDLSAKGRIQSVHRARWDVDAPLHSVPSTVFLDGDRVVTHNTKRHRYELLSPGGALVARTFIDPGIGRLWPSDLQYVLGVNDLGPETVDAIQARHLHARLAPAFAEGLLDKVVARAFSDVPAPTSTKGSRPSIPDVTFPDGALDVWITPDGRVWRRTLSLKIRIATKGSRTTARVVEGVLTVTEHPFEIGVPLTVHVPRPVAPSVVGAETMDELAQTLLAGAADAPMTYGQVVGSFDGLTRVDLARIDPMITWTDRTARADRGEVRLARVRRRVVVLMTRSPTGRVYTARVDRSDRLTMRCRIGRRSCPAHVPSPTPTGLGALLGFPVPG